MTATAMITAVAFDVGGVLSHPPFDLLEDHGAGIGLPPGTLTAFFDEGSDFNAVEIGQLDVRTFFHRMRETCHNDHGVELDLRAVAEVFHRTRQMRPEMLDLARELSARHRIGVLTNNARENEEFLKEALDPAVFSTVVNSGVAGLRKPDPAAYQLLIDRLGVPGHEIVYVDDLALNLPPAEALGMTTILCVSPAQVRTDFMTLGLLQAPLEG